MAIIINPATGLPTDLPDGPDLQPFTPAPPDEGTVFPTTPQSQTTNTEDSGQYTELETPAQQQQRINNSPLSPLVKLNSLDNTVTTVNLTDEVTVTAPRQNHIANPLLDYESYTYSLSLHGISITDYNNLVGNPDGYVPKQVLIAGGGRYGDTFPRNVYFQNTDFFFDDFRMTSVINTTTRNKWSNLIECKFTIIEPLGFTLIKRLMAACMSPDGGIRSPNYLKQPFVLQIDFFGSKHGEDANSYLEKTLKDHTKYIPIRLVEMKSRVTSKGTEYQFEAVPYNHTAFSPTKIVTPADFSVRAKTVKDVFGKGFVISPELLDATQREVNFKTGGFNTNTGDASIAEYYANKPAVTTNSFPDSGLCDKINLWYKVLHDKTGSISDQFTVEFDEVIGNSRIESGGTADTSTVAESGNSKTATQQATGASKSTINFHNQTINIPAGTSLGAVIEWAIVNSEWFQTANIFNDLEAKSSNNKQLDQRKAILNAFKIVPKVKVKEYDPGRADYSYEIIFQVKRWLTNSKATNAAQGRTPGWLKEYNYLYSGGTQSLYTGKFTDNKDVIDLQIDFNMLYYTQVTAFKNKELFMQTAAGVNTATSGIVGALAPELTSNRTNTGTGNKPPAQRDRPQRSDGQDGTVSTYDKLAPPSTVYLSKNARTNVSKGSNVGARVAAADILNTQLIDIAKGDMINVKLKFIGDPTFIKQDDLFYDSGLGYSTSLLTKNNSIRTDDSELYVFLTFRTPDDYDESTGLAIPGQNKFSYTEFTGVYKIITIDSQFTKGKFEQTLDLVKLLTSDAKLEVAVLNNSRVDELKLLGTGQTTRFPSTLPFGPRIVQSTFSGGGNGTLQGLVGLGVNAITNKIITEISTEVNSALADIASSLSSTLEGFALDAQEFLGIGVFSDVGAATTEAFDALLGGGELDVLSGIDFELPSFDWSGVSGEFWV